MVSKKLIVISIITLLGYLLTSPILLVHSQDGMVIESTTVWKDDVKELTDSVTITNGGNLTIIASEVSFMDTESGFILEDDGILVIKNSQVTHGDVGVSGESSGTLTLENVGFYNFAGDVIHLEGDYKVTMDTCKFQGNSKDACQLVSPINQVNITNTQFLDSGKDGLNLEEVDLYIENCAIINSGDEGIQLEGQGSLTAKDLSVSDCAGNSIKYDYFDGSVYVENVTIQAGGDDGLQVLGIGNVFVKNCTFHGNSENGFESSLEGQIVLEDSVFTNNKIHGIELINVTEANIKGCHIASNNDNGIYAQNVSLLHVEDSTVTNNKAGGVVLIDILAGALHRNRLVDNSDYEVLATEIGEIHNVTATDNYWGTKVESEIALLGDLGYLPLLDEKLDEIMTTTPPPMTTDLTTTDLTTTSVASVVELSFSVGTLFTLFLASFVFSYRRRQKIS